MTTKTRVALLTAFTLMGTLGASQVSAGCGVETGSVRILGNDFGAIHSVVNRALECSGSGVTVSSNLTTEHREIQVAALTAKPAQYTTAIVATSSIVPLLNADLVRPLDDLVEKYGDSLSPNQLIRVDGKVIAIAFMANAQHLFYRKDLLEQHGIQPPQTYEDVLVASKKLVEAGVMKYPFVTNSKVGWNLGEEFINMYLGFGGEFFKPGSAEPAINNAAGIATLNMLKDLLSLSNPDFLTIDSNASMLSWETGQAAFGVMWGSRAAAILDNEGSSEEVVSNTVLASAPTVGGNSIPATSLWWDGFVIAKNASDEDAQASFAAMVHAINPAILEKHNDEAVWLIEGYKPSASATGVSASLANKARPYPMLPYMGLLHTALGDELADFLQGKETAEQALADVEATYLTAAKEQGFLN